MLRVDPLVLRAAAATALREIFSLDTIFSIAKISRLGLFELMLEIGFRLPIVDTV